MQASTPPTVRREDYRPYPFEIERIDLEFDLDVDHARVRARSCWRRVAPGAVRLDLDTDAAELLELRIDGAIVEDAADRLRDGVLELTRVPDHFDLAVTTRLNPAGNSALMGLYLSHANYFTQCEAEGFRRITAFPDRPDVMTRYGVTLRADRERCPVLLSNGNLVDQGDCDDRGGWHWARWDDPFPKPSYLFALVAGRFVATEHRMQTASGRPVLLQVWVEPGDEDKTGHAMRSLVDAIRWDERRFGLELDLDRFMIVAVGDFNMGAMENKGLNVFNTRYVFAHPEIATDTDFANVQSVVGHEYFHNWTGNRVTCRDWFQLTLKEGLTVFRDQEFSADMLADASDTAAAAASARAVKRIEDVRVLRATQFPEDAGPMAHPIRPDTYQEINNFYTVTVYEKGAEVVRMLQTLVGREGFRRGVDLYFARHDGHAVTCDDFIEAIADANGRDFTQFRRWYANAGTPRIEIQDRYDPATRRYQLHLRQTGTTAGNTSGHEAFHVPLAIGLVGPDGRDLPLAGVAGDPAIGTHTCVVHLTLAEQEIVFEDVAHRPIPSLLRDFSAPVIIDYPYTDGQLAFLAAYDRDPFNRWEAAQRLATRCMLDLVSGESATERVRAVVDAFARVLDDDMLDPAFKEQVLILPAETFLAEQVDQVDPQAIRASRNALRQELGRRLQAAWRQWWDTLTRDGPYQPEPAQAARRALRNLALGYWADSGATEALVAAHAQYFAADNMTDRVAALHVLINSHSAARGEVLNDFASRYAHQPLAMDKWFTLQAGAHRQTGDPPVLDGVRKLLAHPAFSIKNPNKVRALIGSFCAGNPAEFHAADGSGYDFWAEQVAILDAVNPQVAARLARALDRWRKFDAGRQARMRAAMERVARLPGLSGDVGEILGKSLAA